jgi:hypothetical protein
MQDRRSSARSPASRLRSAPHSARSDRRSRPRSGPDRRRPGWYPDLGPSLRASKRSPMSREAVLLPLPSRFRPDLEWLPVSCPLGPARSGPQWHSRQRRRSRGHRRRSICSIGEVEGWLVSAVTPTQAATSSAVATANPPVVTFMVVSPAIRPPITVSPDAGLGNRRKRC